MAVSSTNDHYFLNNEKLINDQLNLVLAPKANLNMKSHPYLNAYQTPLPPKPSYVRKNQLHFENQNNKTLNQNNPQPLYQIIDQPSYEIQKFQNNFKPLPTYQQHMKKIQQKNCLHFRQNSIISSNQSFDQSSSSTNSMPSIVNNSITLSNHSQQVNAENSFYELINNKFKSNNHNHSNNILYHGLPEKFVKALKTLFDIFDTNKCGFIRIKDIETRINNEDLDDDLDRPQDLIDSLRKVTSPNGLINFSNFCAGIKICLLKSQLNKSNSFSSIKNNTDKKKNKKNFNTINMNSECKSFNTNMKFISNRLDNGSLSSRSSCSPNIKEFNNLAFKDQIINCINENLQTKIKYRPASVPIEFIDNHVDKLISNTSEHNNLKKKLDSKAKSIGNLKDQTYLNNNSHNNNKLRQSSSESRILNNVYSAQEIMNRLYEWRNNVLERKLKNLNFCSTGSNPIETQPNHQQSIYSYVEKKINPRKRENRRHTMTSLHDFNIVKKLLNFEKERELLNQGMIMIDKAKQWYSKNLSIVQAQIDSLNIHSKSSNNFISNQTYLDYNLDNHLSKLNRLNNKICQVNRHLIILMNDLMPQQSYQQGIYLKPIQHEIELQKQNINVIRLKEQNRLLNEELKRNSNLINQLEKSNKFKF